jgi:hypothetical protein
MITELSTAFPVVSKIADEVLRPVVSIVYSGEIQRNMAVNMINTLIIPKFEDISKRCPEDIREPMQQIINGMKKLVDVIGSYHDDHDDND